MRRRLVGLAVVAVLGLVISTGGRLVGRDDQSAPEPIPTASPAVSTMPTPSPARPGPAPVAPLSTTVAGVVVPSGHRDDAQGATAAGVALVELSSQLVDRSEDDVAAVQTAITAAATRDQQVDANRTRIRQLRSLYPDGGLTWRIAVLATRTTVHSPDAVQVAVWRVGVLGTPTGRVTQEWAIVTLELVWENGGWRVLSEQSTPGPVPAAPTLVPTSTAEFDARLAGFTTQGVNP